MILFDTKRVKQNHMHGTWISFSNNFLSLVLLIFALRHLKLSLYAHTTYTFLTVVINWKATNNSRVFALIFQQEWNISLFFFCFHPSPVWWWWWWNAWNKHWKKNSDKQKTIAQFNCNVCSWKKAKLFHQQRSIRVEQNNNNNKILKKEQTINRKRKIQIQKKRERTIKTMSIQHHFAMV